SAGRAQKVVARSWRALLGRDGPGARKTVLEGRAGGRAGYAASPSGAARQPASVRLAESSSRWTASAGTNDSTTTIIDRLKGAKPMNTAMPVCSKTAATSITARHFRVHTRYVKLISNASVKTVLAVMDTSHSQRCRARKRRAWSYSW